MTSFVGRILNWLYNATSDGLGAAAEAVQAAGDSGGTTYKHLLWMMREESGSTTDAWAGQAHSAEMAEEYQTINALLDDKPRLARYRASDNGEGPLFWACFYGPLSLVERLVSLGADPSATTTGSVLIWYDPGGMEFIPRGCTTLMMAAAGGQADIVRYLLALGVPVDAVATDPAKTEGQTALFAAARGRGNAETIEALVNAGADPSLGEDLGFTPAGEAAARGAGDVLAALVEAGADLSQPSGSKSVAELAAASGDPSTMRPLVKGTFGRVLTLDHVTEFLEGADIEHEVVARSESASRDVDVVCYMPVYAKIMDDDHWDVEGSPDFYIFAARSWDELSGFDLEEWLDEMHVGSRRFGSEAEIKGLLGIAEGGITPFAEANDRKGEVVFRLGSLAGREKVALEAFDETRVVILKGDDVSRAVDAFGSHVGPPPTRTE